MIKFRLYPNDKANTFIMQWVGKIENHIYRAKMITRSDSDKETNKLRSDLDDLATRVSKKLEAKDADIAITFADEYETILFNMDKIWISTKNQDVSDIRELLRQKSEFLGYYLKEENKMPLLKYIDDGLHRCKRIVYGSSIQYGEPVLPFSLVKGTREYIEGITYQINGTYSQGLYDACAVMIRRLVETLIIEVFESNNMVEKIKDTQGDFLSLKKLIVKTLEEPSWNLSRNTKAALPNLKDIGDLSAHNRRYMAHQADIDNIKNDLRLAVQELISIAKLQSQS